MKNYKSLSSHYDMGVCLRLVVVVQSQEQLRAVMQLRHKMSPSVPFCLPYVGCRM